MALQSRVTKLEFLLMISIQYQADKQWEYRKISIIGGLLVDPMSNSPSWHHKNCVAYGEKNYLKDLWKDQQGLYVDNHTEKLRTLFPWNTNYDEVLTRKTLANLHSAHRKAPMKNSWRGHRIVSSNNTPLKFTLSLGHPCLLTLTLIYFEFLLALKQVLLNSDWSLIIMVWGSKSA